MKNHSGEKVYILAEAGGRGMTAHRWHRCPNFTHPGTPGSRRRGQRPGAGRLEWVIKGVWDLRESGGAGADLNPPPSRGGCRIISGRGANQGEGVFLPRTSPSSGPGKARKSGVLV